MWTGGRPNSKVWWAPPTTLKHESRSQQPVRLPPLSQLTCLTRARVDMRRSCNISSVVAPHMALNRESGDMNMILIVVASPGIAILRPCVRFRHLRCWALVGPWLCWRSLPIRSSCDHQSDMGWAMLKDRGVPHTWTLPHILYEKGANILRTSRGQRTAACRKPAM